MRRLIIVSGLSGSGKSIVLHALEDMSFYCIDNLPVALLDEFMQQIADNTNHYADKIAIGIDARDPAYNYSRIAEFLDKLPDDTVLQKELVFVEASDDVLVQRFSETRRKHPLSSEHRSLSDAIYEEQLMLSPLADRSNIRIDSSHTTIHQLRDIIRKRVARDGHHSMSVQFMSFGFKNGIPRDADFVFDVRCLPNPHWEKDLRKFSGKDTPIIEYLEQQNDVLTMREDIRAFVERWIPNFEKDNRSYLSIAIGCTGGHHRSVYMTEYISQTFIESGRNVVVRHRDL